MDYMKITYATLAYSICFDNVLCTINLHNHNSDPTNGCFIKSANEEDLKYLTLLPHIVISFQNYNEDKARHICILMGIQRRYNTDHDEHYMGYGLMGYVRDNLLL